MKWVVAPAFLMGILIATPAAGESLEELIRTGDLPSHPTKPLSVTPLLNRIVDGATETSVFLVRRKAHTRTPIHTHDSGGITCLVEGEMTLYIENHESKRVQAPGCFYMPSGNRMIGYNSGDSTAIFYDIFEGDLGFRHWSLQENNSNRTLRDQFGD
jgi:quercetin dioxygenase-like cupin family protein